MGHFHFLPDAHLLLTAGVTWGFRCLVPSALAGTWAPYILMRERRIISSLLGNPTSITQVEQAGHLFLNYDYFGGFVPQLSVFGKGKW